MLRLQYLNLFSLILSLAWSAPAQEGAGSARRPNVLLILTDDQGTLDLGACGTRDIQTPHLDALAARGVRFSQFYAAAPVCSPSRAAFLSGRIPGRAGLRGNVDPNRADSGLPPSTVTIAEVFQAAGYATAQVGKWHLGHAPARQPTGQGFEHSFGHLGGCIDNWSHFFYWNGPNRHDLQRNGKELHLPGRFFPDLMVDEASAFMRAQGERPWLLYFALNTPHYPYQGDPKWLRYYRDLPTPRREYAAFLSTMDARIGLLLQSVDALGLRDDTVIVFQSDHGHSTEQRAFWGGGFAGPYRGAKFSLLEGGLRVPAILSWPGRVPAGEVRGQFATATDWLPTVAELADVALPQSPLDGRSLVPLLHDADAPTPHASYFWQQGEQWALRAGPWKLLSDAQDTSDGHNWVKEAGLRLYHLERDPGEARNQASARPEVVARLHQLAHSWQPALKNADDADGERP